MYSGACRESEIVFAVELKLISGSNRELDVRMRIHSIKERSLGHLVALLRSFSRRGKKDLWTTLGIELRPDGAV